MIETNGLPIILGSGSIWRKKVLIEAGISFTVKIPNIDEKAIRHNNPKNLVLAISQAKAEALLNEVTEPAIIITCDQIVLCNNEIREKPLDVRQAIQFLLSYADFPAICVNGVCVTNTKNLAQDCGTDVAKVFFDPLPMTVITGLVEAGEIMQSAGAFLHQDPALARYINKLEGTSDSVSGLPLTLVEKLIETVL